MSLIFAERALRPERMDTEPLDPSSAERILCALENVNLWLGGVRATLSTLKAFSRRWTPGGRIRIIDWGTGSADIPRAIVRWCRTNGFGCEIVGIDFNAAIVEYARKMCQQYPEIKIIQEDAVPSPQPSPAEGGRGRPSPGEGQAFDYAISSLSLHHMTNNQIIELLRRSDQMTTRGIIMNDLKRSARAWAWIWGLSRLLGAHPIVQHDGPLSVQNAFTKPELLSLAHQAGLKYLNVRTHFGYRLTLAGEKV